MNDLLLKAVIILFCIAYLIFSILLFIFYLRCCINNDENE